MPTVDSATLELLRHDADARDVTLRALVRERLEASPPPKMDDYIVASYFFAFRTLTLDKAIEEISYHATSGIKHPPAGSLLAACSAVQAGVDAFDAARKTGILHVAFPLKMMLQPDGHLTSCDILHTAAGAIIPEMITVFTSTHSRHVREIVTASREGGASLNILSGLVAGNFSAFWLGLAMFLLMGALGIIVAIGWYLLYRNRSEVALTEPERAYLDEGRPVQAVP